MNLVTKTILVVAGFVLLFNSLGCGKQQASRTSAFKRFPVRVKATVCRQESLKMPIVPQSDKYLISLRMINTGPDALQYTKITCDVINPRTKKGIHQEIFHSPPDGGFDKTSEEIERQSTFILQPHRITDQEIIIDNQDQGVVGELGKDMRCTLLMRFVDADNKVIAAYKTVLPQVSTLPEDTEKNPPVLPLIRM